MARQMRLEYPGAIYQVMSRGNGRVAIVADDEDRKLWLETMGDLCHRTKWKIHAFCLMPHHFDLVVETPKANLVDGMKWFLGTYTNRFNRRHKEYGHLFAGRYKSLIVDGDSPGYLKTVCDYVHLNPVRGKAIKPGEALREFAWSSYPFYVGKPDERPAWLRVDRLLREWRVPKDSEAGRRTFGREMERRRKEVRPGEFEQVEEGWYLGGESLRRELLGRVASRPDQSPYGGLGREAMELRAEELVVAGLKRLGWKEADLARRRKGDEGKIRLAGKVRAQTEVSRVWIAKRLHMGSSAYVSRLLSRKKVK